MPTENEVHFVLECPLYHLIRERFLSVFYIVVLSSLKHSCDLDPLVDSSLPSYSKNELFGHHLDVLLVP